MREKYWDIYKKFALIFTVTVFMFTAILIVTSQQKEQARTKRSEDSKKETKCSDLLNCDDCASFRNYKCFWCSTGNGQCKDYPIDNLYPHTADCRWSDVKWMVCWLDFQAIVIVGAVAGVIFLIIVTCILVKFCRCCVDCWRCLCCSWGCCDKGGGLSSSERKSLRNMERSLRMQQKRQELQMKYSTTNRPSGVPYGTTGSYQQFENEGVWWFVLRF